MPQHPKQYPNNRLGFVFRTMSPNVPVSADGKAEAPVYRHIKRWFYRLDYVCELFGVATHQMKTGTSPGVK